MAEKIEEDAKELEKMASKQTLLQSKIQECTKKIRDLGSLPTDAFSKYKNMSQKQLFKQLEKANQGRIDCGIKFFLFESRIYEIEIEFKSDQT